MINLKLLIRFNNLGGQPKRFNLVNDNIKNILNFHGIIYSLMLPNINKQFSIFNFGKNSLSGYNVYPPNVEILLDKSGI